MTIRNRDSYRDAAWDWAILNGCWGKTRIRPSDIDGVVEKNGYFLFIEAKPPNKELDTGQEILLKKLAAMPKVTVLVLWGERDKPKEAWRVGGKRNKCTLEDVRAFCSMWYDMANGFK